METEKIVSPINFAKSSENVFVLKNTFADHGNEIEEIISNRPPLIVRWGTVYFFFLLVLLGIGCWFIQYPDIVAGKAKLNSVNAPKQVITRTDGKLINIAVKENEKVEAGQILGYTESIANPQSVIKISNQVDLMDSLISHNKTDEIIKFSFEHFLFRWRTRGGFRRASSPLSNFYSNLYNIQRFFKQWVLFAKEKNVID